MPTPAETQAWSRLLHERLGLTLPTDRLTAFARWAKARAQARQGLAAWQGQLASLAIDDGAWQEVIREATIGETYFWRHEHHMQTLSGLVLPDVFRRAALEQRPAVIWSAGCASGEEIYSVAMLIDREFPHEAETCRLIGTDINQAALDKARSGTYTRNSMRALPEGAWQRAYVDPAPGNRFEVKPWLRERVRFAIAELTGDDPAEAVPDLGQVDLILCRNVTIYFDAGKRRDLLAMMARRLRPDGWLLMGDTEVDDLVRARFHQHDRLMPSLFRRLVNPPPARPQPAERPPAPPRAEAAVPRQIRPAPPRPVCSAAPPAAALPAETVTAEIWQTMGHQGLQAARALLLNRAAEHAGSPDVQIAMACLALAESDLERALTALRRTLLLSGVPAVATVIQQLQASPPGVDWADQMLTLAELVQKEATHVRRI